MNGRERFMAIMEHRSETCGFWHGNPHPDSKKTLFEHFAVRDDFELALKLGDDVYWCMPEANRAWTAKAPMFDVLGGRARASLNQGGVFADCEDVAEVERFAWPDASALDFGPTLELLRRTRAHGMATLSGMWCCFYHNTADFFGMENYFTKMHTHPEVVLAVTEKVVDFYLRANDMLYDQADGLIDAFFFGNDFGSQLDLLISPKAFATFVMPFFAKLVDQAKSRGLRVMLHSCGAISRVIPDLIAAGVDGLHPIQARARNMDAGSLERQYGGKIVFMGGLDTQHVITFETPDEVLAECERIRGVFGPNFILSPSHECILPNVPPSNVEAMARARR